MDGERGVVRLDDGVRDLKIRSSAFAFHKKEEHLHLGGRDDAEGAHHAVGVLFTDLGDQERAHTRTSPSSEGVGDLET